MSNISEKIQNKYYTTKLPHAFAKHDPVVHKAYYEDCNRLMEEFKRDLFIELGIVGHPKAELLFFKVWEMGHANGFSDVYYYAGEFVEFLR
jgi:hypothetical protein